MHLVSDRKGRCRHSQVPTAVGVRKAEGLLFYVPLYVHFMFLVCFCVCWLGLVWFGLVWFGLFVCLFVCLFDGLVWFGCYPCNTVLFAMAHSEIASFCTKRIVLFYTHLIVLLHTHCSVPEHRSFPFPKFGVPVGVRFFPRCLNHVSASCQFWEQRREIGLQGPNSHSVCAPFSLRISCCSVWTGCNCRFGALFPGLEGREGLGALPAWGSQRDCESLLGAVAMHYWSSWQKHVLFPSILVGRVDRNSKFGMGQVTLEVRRDLFVLFVLF